MNSPKLASYWLDTAPTFGRAVNGAVEGNADVVIIGAGFTGLTTALELAKRGASVAILEAGQVAGEASGRNGGHCNCGLSHDFSSLAATIGHDKAKEFYRLFCDAVDSVERIVVSENIDCSFKRVGRIKLAAKPAHYDHLAKSYDVLMRGVDTDVALISKSELGREIASESFHGGLVQTKGAQLHVGRFGKGLAEACAARGVRIYENAEVIDLAPGTGGTWTVKTARGSLVGKQVFVATGGASHAKPFAWFRRRIVSVGSFIIATEPLSPEIIDRLMPSRRNYVTSKNIGNYFRLAPDNRLIFGGRARFAQSGGASDIKSGRILVDTLGQIFPDLKNVRVDYVWGGTVDMTADRLPRAGQVDGLYYAMGYSGHGVQMSVHTGVAMADVIDGKPEANPWRTLEWPAIPGHFGTAWFLPIVGLWYRWQDILH